MLNALGDCLRYAAFAGVALVGPGLALLRLLRLPVDPALVLPLGAAFAASAYWISLVSGAPWLFPLTVTVLDVALLLTLRRPWIRAEGPLLRGALPAVAAVVLLLAVTQYGGNRISSTGEFLLDNLVPFDTAFHVGLTRELTIGYPPQVPGLSGFPLGYHLGIDLLRAAALRWAGVDPYDSISRLDVTLFAIALVLALRAAAAALGAGRFAVALAGLSVLATDFSFAFALNPRAHWWADLLRGNLLVSLALANPVIVALAVALGTVVALQRHARGEGAGWLAVAALLAAATPFFKVFLGAQLAVGLFGAAVLQPAARRGALIAGALGALATAVLALGQGAATVEVAIDPFDLVRATRDTLALGPLDLPHLALWSGIWLTLSLGLRLAGLRQTLRALHANGPAAPALAVMALVAWPAGLLFRVSAPEMLAGQRSVNDAAYLVEQGGALLWIFTALALERLAGPSVRGRLVTAALAAALALPSTVHFAARKARLPYDPIPAAMVRAAHVLESNGRPGDVVMQRPGARYPPLPVILASRRVPYERFTPWLTQFSSRSALEARHEQVFRFFRTADPTEAFAIAQALDARFVALYGRDRLRFERPEWLVPLHEEDGATVYRISGAPARGAALRP